MGWFGSDDITNNVSPTAHDTLKTVALTIIALLANLAFGVLKVCNSHHRVQSEKVANTAVKLHAIEVK